MLLRGFKRNPIFKFKAYCFRHITELTEGAYNNLAEVTLETIVDSLEDVELDPTLNQKSTDIEVALSQGVLKIEYGTKCWVLNKQTPNRQIWWSSPISGPLRFEYSGEPIEKSNVEHPRTKSEKVKMIDNWRCTRDKSSLLVRLRSELLAHVKYEFLSEK